MHEDWTLLKRLIWLRRAVGGGAAPILKTITGSLLHLTDALARPAKEFVAVLSPKQEGSGDPSPSNVRPISGWTGANIYRASNNILMPKDDNDYYPTFIKAGIQVTASVLSPSENDTVRFYRQDKTQVTYLFIQGTADAEGYKERQYTASEDIYYVKFDKGFQNYQVNFGNVRLPYNEPSATTLPITWQSTAGTVYGGSLTIHEDGTGTLVSSWVKIKMSDIRAAAISPSAYAPGMWYTAFYYQTKKKADGTLNVMSDSYALTSVGMANMPDLTIRGYLNSIYFRDTRYSTSAALLEGMGNTEIAYEIREQDRETYELTAAEVGQLLLYAGENNIWTDASDDLTLTYYADGNVSDLEALNTLLGGAYVPGDVSDRDALNILLGG